MSENSIQYNLDDKKSVSEYVNTEYQKWQEIYDIPLECEFNVRLLLQVRWDILHTQPEHTKTKLDLIKIAEDLQKSLTLKRKNQVKEKIMYIDVSRSESNQPIKIIIYHDDKITIFQHKDYEMDDYVKEIQNMCKDNETATIYVDTNGIGMMIYNYLLGRRGINVQKIKINKFPKY